MNDHNPPPAMVRCFIALPIPSELKTLLASYQKRLRGSDKDDGVRWVNSAQMHLTLRFLGNVAPEHVSPITAALAGVVDQSSSIDLRTQTWGCFPDQRHPKVIWLGLGGELETLSRLQIAICTATQNWGEQENNPFKPHLTLGRVKITRPDQMGALRHRMETWPALEPFAWRAETIEFMQSNLTPTGPVYTKLAEFSLGTNNIKP